MKRSVLLIFTALLPAPLTSLPAAEPAFAIRGTLPWHNFLSGPTAWNENDYRAYLDDLAAHRLNFVAFHCYTGGVERYGPYDEPMIRLKYRDVLPRAGFDTSLTARWGYRPLSVSEFAFETGRLFSLPSGAKAFGADCAVTACSNEDRYRQAQLLMRKVVEMARARGMQVAMGFEYDGWLWHLQLRAASVSEQVKAAHADKMTGVVGIHWRTEEIRQNLEAFSLTARDPQHAPPAEELYRRHCAERYGPESVSELAPLLLRFEKENQLGCLDSPEFFPYTPTWWGRAAPALAVKLRDAITLLDRIKAKTPSAQHRANLDWLADNFRFALLLDEVGRKLEPAYTLKERHLRGEVSGAELRQQAATARRELAAAPVEELFRTFARRVRSRGELGELSALNQKLWLQYRELARFLASLDAVQ